jgi:septum formation protein
VLRRITPQTPLVLGSGSPRRRELLEAQGIPLVVRAPNVDEDVRAGETPADYLARMAIDKLVAVRVLVRGEAPPSLMGAAGILVADTSVLDGDAILGKPGDPGEAEEMLARLSGRTHEVWTSFAIGGCPAPGEPDAVAPATLHTCKTRVTFRALDPDELRAYATSGEGSDKAGGYAVQGRAAAFVTRIEGSYANVVGLPIADVVTALRGHGMTWMSDTKT